MNLEQKPLVIGADIGGSHITAAIINVDEQCLIESSRVRNPVNTHGTAKEILSVWASTLAKIIGDSDPHKISLGIAIPGPFDYKNGISLITNMNKYESLYLIDVKKFLVESLRLRPENIVFTNDAEAFLHGEVNCGGARCFSRALGVTLGTGLGSAVSTDGLTVDSNLGVSPFKEGIAEDYISTRWFVKRYAELTGKQVKDTKTLVGLYAQDPVIAVLFNDFSRNLADFLYLFALRNSAEVIIIGGNIAKAHHLFLDKTQITLRQQGLEIKLKITTLWEDAAMLGAAYSRGTESLTSF